MLRRTVVTLGTAPAAAAAILATAATLVHANPFGNGDSAAGHELHGKQCTSCHRSMFNDTDGATIYSADFRKITNAPHLAQRIETCAAQSGAGWFEEEIESVARYLNETFYRFGK